MNHELTGIPSEIGRLDQLQSLVLSNTAMTTLPTDIFTLTKLRTLSFEGNDFDGTLPTEVGQLTNLQRLALTGTGLDGTLPTELGLLTHLTSLMVNMNGFVGTVPTELGRCVALETVFLYWNGLAGSIDDIFCTGASFKATFENLTDLEADCGGSDPKVPCSCCTFFGNPGCGN
jgi:hypothetical protein